MRQVIQFSEVLQTAVSIHAPAWGATHGLCSCRLEAKVSIHAPAWGATCVYVALWRGIIKFQSTHPRGVRPPRLRVAFYRPGFNPRTRVGCDLRLRRIVERYHQVSIHAPAWGATPTLASCILSTGFQSTHPRGVRLRSTEPSTAPVMWFQSTHPRGVRPCGPARTAPCALFQSTHPRGVRLSWIPSGAWHEDVSIHAPAWGATAAGLVAQAIRLVSIHAPAWGATRPAATSPPPRRGFNPRTRVGCDRRLAVYPAQTTCFNPRTRVGCDTFTGCHVRRTPVSIHAPAWGATAGAHVGLHEACVSIHAPAWGATAHPTWCRQTLKFQSTHPRGVRLVETDVRPQAAQFQSTHPRGVRQEAAKLAQDVGVFQSTHPRGVRLFNCSLKDLGRLWFQSTHPRGVRRCWNWGVQKSSMVSIHAPAWGATRKNRIPSATVESFNPRTRVGCDCN